MIFPIEPRNIANRNNIAYWQDFLTEEDLNIILSLPEWHITHTAEVGVQAHSNGVIAPDIRRTDVAWMNVNNATIPIWQKITNTVAEVNRQYFHFDLTGCYEPAQLSLYTEKNKSHYNWHTDALMGDSKAPRKLTMVLSLSNPHEFEGGELQVKINDDQPQTLELQKGRAWFFPSWVLHRVTPVTAGIRRSLVLWVGGPPFK
jgi:PKHD-type hydroxylase